MGGLDHVLGNKIKAAGRLGPVAGAGSYQNGAAVDRTLFGAALAVVHYQTSGGVTGGAVKVKIEDCATENGTFGTYVAEQSFPIGAGPNEGGVIQFSVDLRGALRWVRVAVDSDPTGGSPAGIIGAGLILGNAEQEPVQ